MRTRGILSIAIIAILLGSLIPITNDIELDDVENKLFANSEPELLIQAGTATGHVNGTGIGATPNGWIVAGDTRNSLTFGSIQLQATSPYNTQLDADTYVAAMDEQGNWLWAVMPDATQGLLLMQTMEVTMAGDTYIAGLMFGTVIFGSQSSSPALTAQNGAGDGFIAKIDPTGQWVWATSFDTAGGTGNFSLITGVAETFTGDVIVSGVHQGSTDFGGITEVSPDDELFLAELSRNSGATNWVVTAGGIGDDEGGPVGVDSMGNIWQVGSTAGSFTENGMTHQAVSQRDTILIKWSPSGVAQDVIGLQVEHLRSIYQMIC